MIFICGYGFCTEGIEFYSLQSRNGAMSAQLIGFDKEQPFSRPVATTPVSPFAECHLDRTTNIESSWIIQNYQTNQDDCKQNQTKSNKIKQHISSEGKTILKAHKLHAALASSASLSGLS